MSGLLGQIEARTKRTGNARHWYGIGRLSDFGFSDAHAEFIANARTDLPRLLAAVRAVEEVHQKRGASWPHNGGVFVCGADGAIWPCPTIRAITEALEGDR